MSLLRKYDLCFKKKLIQEFLPFENVIETGILFAKMQLRLALHVSRRNGWSSNSFMCYGNYFKMFKIASKY